MYDDYWDYAAIWQYSAHPCHPCSRAPLVVVVFIKFYSMFESSRFHGSCLLIYFVWCAVGVLLLLLRGFHCWFCVSQFCLNFPPLSLLIHVLICRSRFVSLYWVLAKLVRNCIVVVGPGAIRSPSPVPAMLSSGEGLHNSADPSSSIHPVLSIIEHQQQHDQSPC